MKKIILFLCLLSSIFIVNAQQVKITGVVKDASTSETLIGATVMLKEGKGTVTDFDGNFQILADEDKYNLTISYIGYKTVMKPINAVGNQIFVEIKMETDVLDEVVIVADVARARETPVAFTNVTPKKLEEELASQDIPMILNSTPGVYSTQQGGGDGDARITIRGFGQNNVGVMIDGIPVNDMENGWVYWSNWFGLSMVTRTMQIQRGLGASKLALPSVGGTLNILTKGIANKRELKIKQSIDDQGKTNTSLGFTSGRLDNGWGFTFAGSYKRGDGWVNGTWSEGWFYFAKIEKRLSNHTLSFTAFGAPQEHAQRSYKRPIATYDSAYAADEFEIDTFPALNNLGRKYNQHWGYLRRTRNNPEAKEEKIYEKYNYYHKPQLSFRDSWAVTDKLFISNIAYLSIGSGGGTRLKSTPASSHFTEEGLIDWQKYYDANTTTEGFFSVIDSKYSNTEYKAGQYLQSSRNNHFWGGLLSTVDYTLNDNIKISGGLDLRSYKGTHYREVYDLLGGDYVVSTSDATIDYTTNVHAAMKRKGDKIDYYDDGLVRWGGIFGQIEYKKEKIATFLNLTAAYSGYKKIDYFTKVLTLSDTTIQIKNNDTLTYNGQQYTINSDIVDYQQSDWKWMPGFTIKTGANYNVTDRQNIFINLGYLSKVPAYKYAFQGYTTELVQDIDNEKIMAIELGYTFAIANFTINLNGYYTVWENKPANSIRTTLKKEHIAGASPASTADIGDEVSGDIPGMDALHKGIECDIKYKLRTTYPKIDIEGLASIGDWTWQTKIDNVALYPTSGGNLKEVAGTLSFDATGVHVSDAAQTQFAGNIRIEPIKGLYLKGKITFFDRYFADFDSESLDGSQKSLDENGKPKDSWQVPAYDIIDFHAGYNFHFEKMNGIKFSLRFNLLNALDRVYIADARNNDPYSPLAFKDFDAKSATVFMGLGRRYSVSLRISFGQKALSF